MQDYRKLKVWQIAHKLTLETYAVSATLKAPRAWPLRNQLLRAAISVPSNIAEGAGRGSDADFRRFLRHSLGSANEVEYDLLLARDFGISARRQAFAVFRAARRSQAYAERPDSSAQALSSRKPSKV